MLRYLLLAGLSLVHAKDLAMFRRVGEEETSGDAAGGGSEKEVYCEDEGEVYCEKIDECVPATEC